MLIGMARRGAPIDEIGYWSEVKLDIIREYAAAYSRILTAKRFLKHLYIDAFAGSGTHVKKGSGELVAGSPLNALSVSPPFHEYHFIDLDRRKVAALEEMAERQENVHVYHGDCNRVLLDTVLPRARWGDYRRALCILDPYGLHLDWRVMAEAGAMRSIDIFLNFPIADINRNVLWRDRQAVSADQVQRFDRFWGDDSWRPVAYRPSPQGQLWGGPSEEKTSNDALANAFRARLKTVAGFGYVPAPVAMRNTQNAVVYYLYFASHKSVAAGIVRDIFRKFGRRGGA